ncbi:hypothetical protein GE09DRAFT_1157635 [Coniochaeta sp. 2T2.1]|nr:hypothetical protein GE09DRAFT_1157635 [Coniochaeta sp. 2T2.1]
MPPIPIYTKSPINAAKADGATPQTAESSEKAQPQQPATTTATPTEKQGGYPPAQPGAAPSLPAVTQVPSHNYIPLSPTPTTTLPSGGPPPPQPGAVPSLPRATAPGTASGPPPPAVTAPAYLPGQGPPPRATSTYPHQMHIPPPTVPQQQRGTSSTAFAVPAPYNTNQGQGADLEHPPGYQQNVQETSSAREDGGYQTAGARPGAHHSSSGWDDGGDGGEEGVWDAAKKWAMAAGDKLSAAEQEVWKRINGKE